MKYFILLASVLFLAQSCSVAPSMRESARSYDWVANTNFSWQSKIDSAISSYPLLLHPQPVFITIEQPKLIRNIRV